MKSIQAIVADIRAIYRETFGGKEKGRYKISRANFRLICGRKKLESVFLEKVVSAALEDGFVVVELGDYFCVIAEGTMLSYRPVPKLVAEKYAEPDFTFFAPVDGEDED